MTKKVWQVFVTVVAGLATLALLAGAFWAKDQGEWSLAWFLLAGWACGMFAYTACARKI